MDEYEVLNVPQPMFEAINNLVGLSEKLSSPSGKVVSDSDWLFLDKLYSFWSFFYKEDLDRISQENDTNKKDNTTTKGVLSEQESQMQHRAEIPTTYYKLFELFYPEESFSSKKFVNKFLNKYKVFSVI